jgi:hypothetical protein
MAELKVNAAEFAEKWGRRMKNSRTDIERGVDRVTQAPGQRAAAAENKMRIGIMEALDSGKWKARVAAVPLEEWKDKTKNKGLARLDSGVDGAMRKVEDIAGPLLNAISSVKDEVDRMPDETFDQRIARMTAFARGMHTKRINR